MEMEDEDDENINIKSPPSTTGNDVTLTEMFEFVWDSDVDWVHSIIVSNFYNISLKTYLLIMIAYDVCRQRFYAKK